MSRFAETAIEEKLVDNIAESSLISTLIQHPDYLAYSDNLISRPRYFYNEDNMILFWAICELYKKNITRIDSINLLAQLKLGGGTIKILRKPEFEDLQKFIVMTEKAARHTPKEYKMLVDRIISLAFKRDLYCRLGRLENECLNDLPLNELNNKVYTEIEDLTKQYIIGDNVQLFSKVTETLWKEIEKRRSDSGVYGIPSKFSLINEYFSYEPTELVLISGRMKKGKSAFMMNEAIDKLQKGYPVLYVDTEMADRLFYERMLANISGVTVKEIKTGLYSTENAEDRIRQAREWIDKQEFIHIYNPSMTEEELYSICKHWKNQNGLQFLIYDYIKSNTLSSSEQYNELGSKCDFLKNNIAGDLEFAVLAGAQLNRENKVADSDKLERYCSVSMKWDSKKAEEYLADGEECGNFKISITLNRIGEQMQDGDYIDMMFDGNKMQIEEAEQQHKKSNMPF